VGRKPCAALPLLLSDPESNTEQHDRQIPAFRAQNVAVASLESYRSFGGFDL